MILSVALAGKCGVTDKTTFDCKTASQTDLDTCTQFEDSCVLDIFTNLHPSLTATTRMALIKKNKAHLSEITPQATTLDQVKANAKELPVEVFQKLMTFVNVPDEILASLDKDKTAALSKACIKTLNETQATKIGAEKPAKNEDVKKASETHACLVLKKLTKDDFKDDKVQKAVSERCKWVPNSSNALQVAMFLTVASVASVLVSNLVAF